MNLQQLVRHYTIHKRPRAKQELDWFGGQDTLEVAIEYAALARDERGKRYSHQRRIKSASLQEACKILLSAKCTIEHCKSFDDLLTLIEGLLKDIHGLGKLYYYDTALRIGSRIGLMPSRIYLHAGTRAGAKVMGLGGEGDFIEHSALPVELHQLEPHEIEDFLCIYKEELTHLDKV